MTENEPAKSTSNYAQINGLNMYYEVHGEGEPLILLHGGLGSSEMFGAALNILAMNRKVFAVDLQAHGRTADINRPLRFELMADDIAGLIEYLHFESANVMGYSLGGGVALRTAIQHPDKVKKLVVVSTPFRQNGWYPEILAGMAQMSLQAAEPMKQTPMYQNYAKIAPRPEDWPILLSKTGELLRQNYDWSKEVESLKVPTMIVIGDSDAVRPAHAVEFFATMPICGMASRNTVPGMPDNIGRKILLIFLQSVTSAAVKIRRRGPGVLAAGHEAHAVGRPLFNREAQPVPLDLVVSRSPPRSPR